MFAGRVARTAADPTSVDVSVLVPVLNEEAHIEATLEDMRAQEFDGTVEFLLIDGGSTDRSRELIAAAAEADPRIRLLSNPDRTTPHALNIGLREARGEYVARMDAHTHYRPDYLARGVERLRRGEVDWVAGPAIAAGSGKWSRRVSLALATRLGTGGGSFRRESDAEYEADTGFAGVWQRSYLEQHGGWDEGWPINQDAELAARVRKAGGRIVCVPEMAATSRPRDSLSRLARQYGRYGIYREKTSWRHPESMRRSHVLAPGVAVTTIAAIVGPRRLRRLARVGLVSYLVAVVGVSASEARTAGPRDAAALPAVFITMHLAWGFGFLAGCLRFGPPLAAVAKALRGAEPKRGAG